MLIPMRFCFDSPMLALACGLASFVITPIALAGGPTDTVGHWKLDETSGTVAADSSGNGNDGTYTNGPTLGAAGIVDTAVDLDGSNDYVSVTSIPQLDTPAAVTVACWAKSDTTTWNSWGMLVSKRNQFVLHPTSGTTYLRWYVHGAGFGWHATFFDLSTLSGFDITEWHHYAGVYDPSGSFSGLYVDGVLVASRTDLSSSLSTDTGALEIGKDDSESRYFDGSMDEVRVYNRALSGTEIEQLYGGLVGHYRLDESTGTVAADSSGNGNDGTYVNGVNIGQPGRTGNAAEFNQSDTDDRIDLPNTLLDGAIDASVSFWIKTTHTGGQAVLSGANSPYDNEFLSFFGPDTSLTLYKKASYHASTISSISDNRWHHFVYTMKGSTNEFVLYQNGVLINSFVMGGTLGVPLDIDPGGLILGLEQDSVGGGFQSAQSLDGTLDDVRIYQKVLTAEEVTGLYNTLDDGLVGHWKLDETSGTTAADSSGLGNDGTYQNSPILGADGIYSKATDFDGTDDYVALGNPDSLNFEGTITLSAWVKSENSSSLHAIVSHGHRLSPDGEVALKIVAGNYVLGSWGNVVTVEVAADDIGRWVHLVGLYDGTTWRLYRDGVEIGSLVASTGSTTVDEDWAIGARGTGTHRFFDGGIDDVRIYDRALSDTEIKELYGLMGHWKLDETSGTVAADSSGLGRDGTHVNSPIVGEDAIYDKGVTYNGTSQETSIADHDDFSSHLSTGLSVSAWVKVHNYNTDSQSQTRQPIVSKGQPGNFEWALYLYDTGQLQFSVWTLSGGSHSEGVSGTDTIVPTGSWAHLVATYEEGVAVKIYLNGELVLQSTIFNSTPGNGIAPVLIGARVDNQHLNATIDEVRIYNRVLTTTQIAELYGLMGHWKLDETSGTVAADSSGLGHDGTYINGSTVGVEGVYGKAAHFEDHPDDHAVTLPTISADVSQGFTLAFWTKQELKANNLVWNNALSFSTSNSYGSIFLGARGQYLTSYTRQDRGTGGANGTFIRDTTELATGRWEHCVFTFDADSQCTIYRNGEVVASGTSYSPDATLFENNSIAGGTFSGDMDDVRFYNRALTETQVKELYGLLGHWKLDETSGTVAAQESGVWGDGTHTGGTTPGAAAARGYGTAYDGVDGITELPAKPLDFSDGLGASFWYKINTKEEAYYGALLSLTDTTDNLVWIASYDNWGLQSYTVGPGNTGTTLWNGTPPSIKQWHHYALSVDSDGNGKVYHDGKEVASGPLPLPDQVDYTQNRIGSGYWDLASHADLDDLHIYNRRLTEGEIAEQYGLMLHLKMDDTSVDAYANGAQDSSPYDTDATVYNVEAFDFEAPRGKGMQFDGTTSYLEIERIPQLDHLEALSVACWAKSDTETWNKSSNFAAKRNQFILYPFSGTTEIGFYTFDPGGSWNPYVRKDLALIPGFNIQTWHHYVGTYDPVNGKTNLYVDGELFDSTVTSALIGDDTGKLLIGANDESPIGSILDGAMDNVRVFNRALTDKQVVELYGLVGHWKMDDLSGSLIASDSSGMENHGDLITGNGQFVTSGKWDGALELDATDYVDVPDAASLNPPEEMTLSAWVKPNVTFGSTANDYPHLFHKQDYDVVDGHSGYIMGVLTANLDQLGLSVHDGLPGNDIRYEEPSFGGWIHVVGTYDGVIERIYRNGVLRNERPLSITLQPSWQFSLKLGIRIEGQIDDMRVYNRRLTDEEVRTLYYGKYVPGLRIVKWVEVANP